MSEPTALEMLRTLQQYMHNLVGESVNAWAREILYMADELIPPIIAKLEAEQEVTKQLEELNRNLRIKTELDAGGGYPE